MQWKKCCNNLVLLIDGGGGLSKKKIKLNKIKLVEKLGDLINIYTTKSINI